ncbi:MAG: methyl-accepting chemotaxis protein, partial [Spartobacteria bacterium]|nr:methyl-accepting chemotaxis protein [Spartobacteria bacterium]
FTSVFIEQSKIGRTGYLTMLDERGMIISHPQKDLILNQEAAPKVADIMQKIQAGETHFISTFDGRVKQYHVDRFSSDEFNILHTWYILFGQELTEINEEAAHLLARVIWCMLILLAALSALTVLFSHLLITRPLKRLTIVANHVADGDLSRPLIEVKRNDEIGVLFRAINKMTESLQRQTRQIQEALGVLADSTGYIVSASQQQEALARQNGTATTSVTAAVKEITATSRELARTMQAVQQRSEVTGELADGGRAGLGEMQQSMGHLDGARQSILTRLEQINEKAGLIGNVVTMVGKVAGQTNILSLNASIEAERAGEYGRGFSVVAREMRRLADQTAVAMLNIERSISEMQGAVTAGVMEMDKFSSEVQQSIASVDTIHSRLSEIIQNVGELTPQFMQVNEGMQAQYEGAEHIAQAMTHISEGASETGASITRMNEAIQRLNDAAEALKYEISRFRLGG